ncbi:MAG: elongation factor G [Clostridia bacterium]|nr:elongation factor G [Clostridia bacterium]
MGISTQNIRNIALIGHAGEGKTTLAEAILFNCKAIDRQGRVDDGNTCCDFDPEEIARKTSISLAVANGEYKGTKLNILDVPGFFDFEGEMVQALTVADGAVVVTGASGQMTVGTELALDYCIKHNIPTIIFISGLDKDNTSYADTVEAIRQKYPTQVAPMFVPFKENDKFAGWVDIALGKAFDLTGATKGEIPQSVAGDCSTYFDALAELAAGSDEELMEKFFDEGTLSGEDILKGVKLGVKSCSCIPVFGGAGLSNRGINNLIENIIALLPSPDEAAPAVAKSGDDLVEIKCDPNGKVVLRIFKTMVDPFVGRLNMFKVISGTLNSGATLRDVNKENDEKISAIYYVKGKKQEPTSSIVAGDIGALAKLGDVTTGDTLTEDPSICFEPIVMPAPVYSMAVFAAKKGEEDKVFGGLSKLKDEDISFTVTKNAETNEMLLSGIGETQLSILCKKLKNKFGSEAILKEPRIAYRETVRKMAEAEGKHKKQSGGAGQFGDCWVRFEPGAEDGVYEFVDAVVGGAVPRQFIPAVDKGLREAIKEGVLAGYPMVNLKCTLFDGKYHPVDSKEIAFITAAKLAYAEGVAKASPCILEPIMHLEVTVPDSYMGDVMGDMNKRRGRILGTDQVDGKSIVSAEAPQSELSKYATDLRSMTQGRGRFKAEFVRYEEVPPTAQDKIIKEAKERAAQ